MTYEKVLYSLTGNVARISMNDPGTRNAGSAQMGEELVHAFNRAAGEARAVGRVRAMELMLLGERLMGPKALEWGLVNYVVPDDEVEAKGMELAARLARGPRSLGIIKRNAWAAVDVPLETALVNERNGQREACRSEDFIEGVNAFKQKRAPEFKGK